MVTFTQSELASAILGATRNPEDTPNSITTSELARIRRCSMQTARNLLKDAVEAGVMMPVWVTRVTPHGVARRYEGYVLVERSEAS